MHKLITSPTAIWLTVEPVDMRRGIDGLSMIAQQALVKVPSACATIVFRNRLGNRIKVLLGTARRGGGLCQHRLHEDHFIWPKSTDTCFSVTFEQVHGFCELMLGFHALIIKFFSY